MEGSNEYSSRRPDAQNHIYDGEHFKRSRIAEERITERSINQCENREKLRERIYSFREHRKNNHARISNLVIVKRSNKVVQALNLPKVLNLNPHSAMNKIDELKTFIEEEAIDCAFISESHDRENKKLEENLQLDDHVIISNIYQRHGKGGRPALIVNKQKFNVQNLTNTLVDIPWGC